ncbi:hypothetical protein PG996_004903 [Apiospora saccharicola]|uniref:Uncharacterized protein n=1 Tax=Apiospora saccharicola TaxID=335842 RepID=A0ABR1VMX0_9PEZI
MAVFHSVFHSGCASTLRIPASAIGYSPIRVYPPTILWRVSLRGPSPGTMALYTTDTCAYGMHGLTRTIETMWVYANRSVQRTILRVINRLGNSREHPKLGQNRLASLPRRGETYLVGELNPERGQIAYERGFLQRAGSQKFWQRHAVEKYLSWETQCLTEAVPVYVVCKLHGREEVFPPPEFEFLAALHLVDVDGVVAVVEEPRVQLVRNQPSLHLPRLLETQLRRGR